jgi:hypothetical protein
VLITMPIWRALNALGGAFIAGWLAASAAGLAGWPHF